MTLPNQKGKKNTKTGSFKSKITLWSGLGSKISLSTIPK